MPAQPLSMETLPAWNAPHAFGWEGERVFSFGLLLPEIGLLASDAGRARLASRWGTIEVLELAGVIEGHREVLAPEQWREMTDRARERLVKAQEDPELPTYPGLEVTFDELRARLEEAPTERPTVQVIHPLRQPLLAFSAALGEAADASETVPAGFERELKTVLDKVERLDRIAWAARIVDGSAREVRTCRYNNLLERVAIEWDHLVTHRPRLSRCKLCKRVFVPIRTSRPEVHCRAHLWRVGIPPQHVESCVRIDDDTERRRMGKRLQKRYLRALERNGPKHADTKATKAKYADWVRENPSQRERGRQPRPDATYQPGGDDDGETT
jgi:hypothetical protein